MSAANKTAKATTKAAIKTATKAAKKKRKTALVVCRNGQEFWTTQAQFWQWVRDRIVTKSGDNPLRGEFVRQNEEYSVTISNTVLNLKCPNHLREALAARKIVQR